MAETETAKPVKKGRRNAETNPDPSKTFFQKVNNIARSDWGTRARIYVYRVEPIIDRLRSGEKKYIMAYDEPVNENRLLADHGSGRYKLVLNFRKPGAEQGDEIDSLYLEMLNPEFPPRIPSGEWVEDPRNKKWAWAKPAYDKQQQAQNPTDPVPMLRVFNEIRDSVKDESADPLDILVKAKTIFAPPASENAVLTSIVALMNQQSESNSKLVLAVMSGAQKEASELRDEVRRMREQPEKKNGIEAIKEWTGVLKELTPTVKELFPGLKAGAEAALNGGRSRMSGWQEFLVGFGEPILSGIINSPVANALGQIIVMKAAQSAGVNGAAPPATNGATRPTTNPALNVAHGGPSNLVDFFNMVWPAMFRHLKEQWTGAEFAEWLYDGYGNPYNGVDWLKQSREAGALAIIAAFRQSPFWPQITVMPHGEPGFNEFVNSFVGWSPQDQDADDIQDAETDEDVIDLTAAHAGAGGAF